METDYKKKYEEALSLAKSYYGKGQNEFLDTLFPELRESEDERIRAFLYDFIKVCAWSEKQFPPREKCLAYLEKQKEQTEDLSTRLNGVMQEYVKAGKDEEEQEHRLKCYQLFWDALGDSEFFKQKEQKPAEKPSMLEQLREHLTNTPKEQLDAEFEALKEFTIPKSAEWSDTDNIGWDEAFACVTRAEKAAKNEEELQNAVTAEKWLKEIRFKYYVHPDKPEWSEEDEKTIKEAIHRIEQLYHYWNRPTDEKLIERLKSLKNRGNFPKSNTNSPSWSEEDEKTINDACCWIEEYAGYLMDKNYGKASMLMSLTEKLKSLCPSWKPSEEQMKALNALNCYGALSYVDQQNHLISLYNDLKKLM